VADEACPGKSLPEQRRLDMKISLTLVRNIFLAIFIVAVLAAFAILYRETYLVMMGQAVSPGNPEGQKFVLQLKLEKLMPVVASVITSLTALVGFVLTAILSVRKERRDARESALSLKQKELDLQRALIELEELKKKVSQ
jgi:hypothetical protein